MCIALRHETLEADAIVDVALELSDKPGRQHGALKTPHWHLAHCSQPIRDVDSLHALLDGLFGQMESAGLRSAARSASRSRDIWSCRKAVAHVSVPTGCFIPVARKRRLLADFRRIDRRQIAATRRAERIHQGSAAPASSRQRDGTYRAKQAPMYLANPSTRSPRLATTASRFRSLSVIRLRADEDTQPCSRAGSRNFGLVRWVGNNGGANPLPSYLISSIHARKSLKMVGRVGLEPTTY